MGQRMFKSNLFFFIESKPKVLDTLFTTVHQQVAQDDHMWKLIKRAPLDCDWLIEVWSADQYSKINTDLQRTCVILIPTFTN